MRLLLASNAQYFPAHGGGERSNRMLMEALAAHGHECVVVTRAERAGPEGGLRDHLKQRALFFDEREDAIHFTLGGVRIVTATHPSGFRTFFEKEVDRFHPDIIITSTDDPAQVLLEPAIRYQHAPTVFLTRATIALPFGPDAAFKSREKTKLLREVDGVVGVSQYVADYVRIHSGIEALHVPIALPDSGPHPNLGRFDNEFITLVNPCAVKGLPVFLALADKFPQHRFAGVPTWGTTAGDLASLRERPNVTVLPKVDDIHELLRRTRVLLVPSLWAEARSRIVVEAMLAGVPVMASNIGGLPEAKMHVPPILPVRPITQYLQRLNEQMVPEADVPEQDIAPWADALHRLISDEQHWLEVAAQSRTAALHYASTTSVEPFETYLASLKRGNRIVAATHPATPRIELAQLSPERKKLLDLRLKKQTQNTNAALPLGVPDRRMLRLFCFPHAGGGATFFRNWRHTMTPKILVAPVQYPGHETRRTEPLAVEMPTLVENLFAGLQSELTGDYAFFGHSMGAIVAFELARRLAASGATLPNALIVSAARSPVFRLNHQPPPEPVEADFLSEVRRLGGLPDDVLDNPHLLASVLPSLRSDARLYSHYQFRDESALPLPVLALGGRADANVMEHHLSRWNEVTTAPVLVKTFPGGHFFLRDQEGDVLATIADFLEHQA